LERLNSASISRYDDAAALLAGRIGPGQIIPDEQLAVAGLGLDLTAEQRATLSREQTAAMLREGIAFEAVLMAGLSLYITRLRVADPRLEYALHEIGEETRHSRVFLSVVDQVAPTAVNPLAEQPWLRRLDALGSHFIIANPAVLFTMILGGEEIPDLIQKLAAEHPDTDPHLAAVARYHRREEARHLAFAQLLLPEAWAAAGPFERRAVRHLVPVIIGSMWDFLIHPGVYATVGLPAWETWKAVKRCPQRVALRHRATRPVLDQLIAVGAIDRARVPRQWRTLCGV
jgi:hypothetical protein